MVLSQVNGIYDPLGFASPFTVKAKILMRKLWSGNARSLGWDDPMPATYRDEWIQFFREVFQMKEIAFTRCIRPTEAVGDPTLVVFSDGSDDAFGAYSYLKWELDNGSFHSSLMVSKNRITPLRKISTVRSELSAAVIAKYIRNLLKRECRLKYSKEYFIVDSEIIRAMIQKDSYRLNTFVALRIGEIQEATNPSDWYWVDGKLNISDWLTKRKSRRELGEDSLWQRGPDFLRLPENQWSVKQDGPISDLPEQIKPVMLTVAKEEETLSDRIDINRFSACTKLLHVTARILAMYKPHPQYSFANAARNLTPQNLEEAERFWITDAQKSMKSQLERGDFNRLCPSQEPDGIIEVGGRVERCVQISYDNQKLVLLPYNHRFSRLFAEHVHNEAHLGNAATVSKIRLRL